MVNSGEELSGDTRLPPLDRIRYLVRNLRRNLDTPGKSLPTRLFCRGQVGASEGTPSPGRLLGQIFVQEELPRLLSNPSIRVLDIGCGSGRMCDLLAQVGYRGTYVGVDIGDRFSREADSSDGFVRRFVHGDAHDLPESETYDLVFSNSALEHIPDDCRLLDKLGGLVMPGGMQVHIVPSGWGLMLYLWHGYRQYPLSRIKKLFSADAMQVFRLGGLCCFLLHFVFISFGEIVLRLKLRAKFPRAYRALLNKALVIDRVLGICPGMYIVCHVNRNQGGVPVDGDA